MKNNKVISMAKFKPVPVSEKNKGLSYYNEGLYFYEKEDYEKALKLFLKSEKTGFESVDMMCNLSWMYGEKDNGSRLALYYAKKALKMDEDYGRPYILVGNVYYWEKDGYDKALEYYLKAEEKDYLDTYTARRISIIYGDKDNKFKALEYALKAYKMDKNDAISIHFLADVYYYQEEDYKQAYKYYQKYDEVGGTPDWTVYVNLSYCCCVLENFKKSLEYANKAAFLNRDEAFVYYRKGIAYWCMDDYNLAEKEFLKAEKLGCKDADLYYRLAYIYYEKRDDEKKFVDYIQKTLKYEPHSQEALYSYGYYLFDKLKDYKQALKIYKKAMKYAKVDFRPEYYLEYAQMYFKSHKYKLAREKLAQGLEIYPDNKKIKDFLEYLQM